MVEAVPQAEAFPTGENDRTRKCFGLCELYEAQRRPAGVNKNPANSLGEKELAPQQYHFQPVSPWPRRAAVPEATRPDRFQTGEMVLRPGTQATRKSCIMNKITSTETLSRSSDQPHGATCARVFRPDAEIDLVDRARLIWTSPLTRPKKDLASTGLRPAHPGSRARNATTVFGLWTCTFLSDIGEAAVQIKQRPSSLIAAATGALRIWK